MALEIDLVGRVALVTGGSRGLGRADALALARAGADVVIADIQVESDESTETAERYGVLAQVAKSQGIVYTEQTAQEIQGMGRRAAAIKCDVTDREQVDETVARAVDEFGSVDILINNAGTLDHVGAVPRPEPRAVGARPPGQSDGRLQLRAGGLAAHAGAELGPDREHGVGRGHARRLRPGELLDDEGGHPRPDPDARAGGRPARDHLQRDRARRSSAPRHSTSPTRR